MLILRYFVVTMKRPYLKLIDLKITELHFLVQNTISISLERLGGWIVRDVPG